LSINLLEEEQRDCYWEKINFNMQGYLKILLFRRKVHEKKFL